MTSPGALEFGVLMRRLTGDAGLAPGARRALDHMARRLWDALRDGHACLRLASLRASLPAGLSGSDLDAAVAHAIAHAPWLLDIEHDRVWLRRMARLEQAVADGLRRLDVAHPLAEPERVERWITDTFGAAADTANALAADALAADAAAVAAADVTVTSAGDTCAVAGAAGAAGVVDATGAAHGIGPRDASQRQAVRVALARRLLVLTGGPGTGKTATLARIVQAARELGGDPAVRVAAPTGKAAARLGEQLRARGVSGIDPTTVHALLEIDRSGRARRDRSDPIAADLVLIDECSMLDLRLCARLLDALAPGARLVLAGDRDQLASVDPGAVFAELTAPGVLPDALVALTHNFRQQDAARLAAFAEATRLQRLDDAHAAFAAGGHELRVRAPAAQADAFVAEALDGYAPLLEALQRDAEPAALLATLDAYRMLTALREGPLGAVALNHAIGAAVRARCDARARIPAWRGRLLMVTANDREQRLWNGDVGLAAGDGTVLFPDPRVGAGVRRVPHAALPAHEDAFAMTVHKAQGSEFDAVSLLPAPAGHALAVRELLYTGITRARRRCTVHADARTLLATLAAVTRREGALGLRLG